MSGTKIALMYDFRMRMFFMFVHTIELNITFIFTPIIISVIEGHTNKKLISVHDVIFRFGISRYSILKILFGDCALRFVLWFHVTYLNCLSMSKISMTLLLPTGDLVCLLLISFGFLFLVVIEIGSRAHFTCFSYVDLSCIFWSISNLFFPNTVSSLLMCFSSSLWNIFQ